MTSISMNSLLTPASQNRTQRASRADWKYNAVEERPFVHYARYICCAVIGILMFSLMIFNSVTTSRLQEEIQDMQDQIEALMIDLNYEDDDLVEISSSEMATETEPLKRSQRSLDRSAQDIPVIDESYAVLRQRTNSPADDIIEDMLLNKPATVRPTMVYDWNRRQKRFHSSSDQRPNDLIERPWPSVPNSEHLQNRAGSRVMSTKTNDRSKAFRQIMTKRQYEQWQAHVDPHRAHPNQKMHKSLETVNQQTGHRVRTIIAVHYGAARKRNPVIPAHVRNVDWQASKWVNQLAMDRFFQNDEGIVRVRQSGLYQVYAQITFEKGTNSNGFIVVHNAERFLECKTSTLSSNSCYTSRVVYMESDDQIRLSDMFANQRVVLHEGQSFFGLMKLGQVQGQTIDGNAVRQ